MKKSNVYGDMINHHRENVKKAWELLAPELSSLDEVTKKRINNCIEAHDLERFSDEEFYTYIEVRMSANFEKEDAYKKMEVARLIHLNTTPYHWQYYYCLDELGEETLLEMPKERVIEMVCDIIADAYENKDQYLNLINEDHLHFNSRAYYNEVKPFMNKILSNFD